MSKEHISKTTLLENVQKEYNNLEQLLSSLTEKQMTTSVGDGAWSVKDNIAHLIAWQQRSINLLHAVRDNRELPDPTPNMSEDEINEMFYQRNKALPLNTVLSDLHSVQQHMIDAIQALSEEDLNKPIPWLDNRAVVEWVIGNTYAH